MQTVETLRIIHFDRRQSILAVAEYAGDETQVILPLRTIIADALRFGTTGLLLSHNHPSGDPTPSGADIATTRRLVRVAEGLGICVHDHIVLGASRSMSFRAAGLL